MSGCHGGSHLSSPRILTPLPTILATSLATMAVITAPTRADLLQRHHFGPAKVVGGLCAALWYTLASIEDRRPNPRLAAAR
jgi:hypothetical protein